LSLTVTPNTRSKPVLTNWLADDGIGRPPAERRTRRHVRLRAGQRRHQRAPGCDRVGSAPRFDRQQQRTIESGVGRSFGLGHQSCHLGRVTLGFGAGSHVRLR
jgi:hypothetical protein